MGVSTRNCISPFLTLSRHWRSTPKLDFLSNGQGRRTDLGLLMQISLQVTEQRISVALSPASRPAGRVYTEADFPRDWARIQIHLGNVSLDAPSRGPGWEPPSRHRQLRSGVSRIYRGGVSLRVGRGEYNLGLTYANSHSSNRDDDHRRAIACFEAALRVFAEPEFPVDWAMTQYNLGCAYQLLPSGRSRREPSPRSHLLFEAALRVYTETEFPFEWPAARHNLEAARQELDSLQVAPV